MKYRHERFGGIIGSEAPPFLAMVDRDYMRKLGLGESDLWEGEDETVNLLSAPLEVHFAITNTCGAGCAHCYMSAGERLPDELGTDAFKASIDVLAEMKVFHIALGGGEALERDDLFEIAVHARARGLVPNLTVSGRGLTDGVVWRMTPFGQVNVSIDGIGDDYDVFRGEDAFEMADRAVRTLKRAGVRTGMNCVVGRRNFDGLERLFEYACDRGLQEIEFLRFKPAGRGRAQYRDEKTTHRQNMALIPMLSALSDRYGITAKIDCSFVPMLCYRNPPLEYLEATATYGCEAGNILLGVRSDGSVCGCSFLESTGLSVFDLKDEFDGGCKSFHRMRSWTRRAVEPCRSCRYLTVCKGGCHGVAEYVTGSLDNPDPDCPFVVEFGGETAHDS